MTLLVIGRGAEDAEDDLGRTVLDAYDQHFPVLGFDPHVAVYTTLWRTVEDVVSWLCSTYEPAVVLVVDSPQSTVSALDVPAARVLHTTREVALAGISRWSLGKGGPTPDDGSPIAELWRALDQAARPTRVVIEDRSPRVSLVIPIYNQEKYLHATLQSALANTYDDFEVVALDDGSTDASPSILDQYRGDPRLVVITQENVGGTGRLDFALNRVMRAARGDLIAGVGGDDVSLPHRLTAQVAAFDEDPDLGVCHSGGFLIDSTGSRFGTMSLTIPYDELSFLRDMQMANLVAHPTVMHSRKALDTVGWYEEGLACDYHWWMKAAGRVRFRYLPQRLIEYRIHDRGMSTTTEGSQRCAREAHRHRRIVVQRRTLADFYPELDDSTSSEVWLQAGLALGNSLIHTDPFLAGHIYRLALEARPDHRASYNIAVAAHLDGDRTAALEAAGRAAEGSARGDLLHRCLQAGQAADIQLFGGDEGLSAAINAGRSRLSPRARRWDGSPVGVQSAYVALDPVNAVANERIMSAWSRSTRPTSPVRWVYPDLGLGLDVALERLTAAAAGAGDLRAAADIAIDVVDDFILLPPDPERPTGTVSLPRDHDIFTSWMVRSA